MSSPAMVSSPATAALVFATDAAGLCYQRHEALLQGVVGVFSGSGDFSGDSPATGDFSGDSPVTGAFSCNGATGCMQVQRPWGEKRGGARGGGGLTTDTCRAVNPGDSWEKSPGGCVVVSKKH